MLTKILLKVKLFINILSKNKKIFKYLSHYILINFAYIYEIANFVLYVIQIQHYLNYFVYCITMN